jgi:hypothetical protein
MVGHFLMGKSTGKRCDTKASIPLQAIGRGRNTPIWKLEASLKCSSCQMGKSAPPAAGAATPVGYVGCRSFATALSAVIIKAPKEGADKRGDLVGRFVECEMSGFQEVNFRLRHVVGVGRGAGDGKRRVVFAPNHQH